MFFKDTQVAMFGLNISCSCTSRLALVWSVRLKSLSISSVGCLGDEEGGCPCCVSFLNYNQTLDFYHILHSFYLQKLILYVAMVPLNGVQIGVKMQALTFIDNHL